MRPLISMLLVSAMFASQAKAIDVIVDASGGGDFTTIGAAMLVVAPGDRILVEPGTYPAFHFSRGVAVIGRGATPSAVRIARVDYHVTMPTVGFETLLSNATIGSPDPADAIAISGNEIGPGALTLDGLVVDGSMFLRGGSSGFHLLVNNCRVTPNGDENFSGAAATLGGANNVVEIRNSWIRGSAAGDVGSVPPGVGLQLIGGTEARIVRSEIAGGDGYPLAGPLEPGAAAIRSAFGSGALRIRLDGGSVVAGGDSGGASAGGAGIALSTAAHALALGDAVVTGGAGSTTGPAYVNVVPTSIAADRVLELQPIVKHAESSGILGSGDTITLESEFDPATTVIVIGLDMAQSQPSSGGPATAGSFLALDPAKWLAVVPASDLSLPIPGSPGVTVEGVVVRFQAYSFVPGAGIVLSNTECVRIDLQP
jgi:hypothetical protein